MRSVVVVLPASMCAAMPILRVHSSGNGRSFALTAEILALSVTTVILGAATADMGNGLDWLPAEVSEGTIRLRHLVGVFLLFDDRPRVVIGVDDLSRERVLHRHALASPSGIHDPT